MTTLTGYSATVHIPQDFNSTTGDGWNGFDCLDTGSVTDGSTTVAAASVTTGVVWYQDTDGDGYGSATEYATAPNCTTTQPTGYMLTGGDCNDTASTTTAAGETLTASQQNPTTLWYNDVDGDGYSATNASTATYLVPDTSGNMCHCDSSCGTLNACVAYVANNAGGFTTQSCAPADTDACARSCPGGVLSLIHI